MQNLYINLVLLLLFTSTKQQKSLTNMPHIALLPSPGMGHLIPLTEFAKRLVHLHNFTITFILPLDAPPSNAQKSTIQNLPSSITIVFLPQVNLNDLAKDTRIETFLSLTMARSLPSLRNVLKMLVEDGNSPTTLVIDLFGTDAFDLAKEFNIRPYLFFPSTAMCLALFLYLEKLDKTVTSEYKDWTEPINIPGCIPVSGKDLIDPLQDRKNECYGWMMHHAKRYRLAEGIIENSFTDLEPATIKALQMVELGKPPVYPLGPLINMDRSADKIDGSCSLEWLDYQPHGSVLFVSFGSMVSHSLAQTTELALGLELSAHSFLWVVRRPNDVEADDTQNEPFWYLPDGFLERTKNCGLVVDSWVPQVQVLSHVSTGGFLSHCGWNSTLESVVNGVPLITWPLYAEQKMNALMLTEDIKVGIPVNANQENGLVERQEIARVVKGLMEGEEGKKVGYKMKELKEAASIVLSQDGSSTKALAELAQKWNN